MDELYNQIISKAREKYGEIVPCGGKPDLYECFTYEPLLDLLIFWFNPEKSRSTHALTYKIVAQQ